MTVFLKKRDKEKIVGFPVASLMRQTAVKGDIGIEIEVEGNIFRKTNIPSPWKYVKDGSLRGDDNAEYVLIKPILFNKVESALTTLWDMFKNDGSVLDVSNRTSVHIHLNTQKFYLNRLCAFMGLYLTVEEILTAWCGEHRIGNLFCLQAKDAPNIVSQLKRFFQAGGSWSFSEGMHYAGMNASALQKFGSLEFRSLRGVTDPEIILDWVSVLERLYTLSETYTDPRDVCYNFSGEGAIAFLQRLLGDKYETVRSGIPHTEQELRKSLYEGIRLAQDLCYCIDWSLYEPLDTAADPFGRNNPNTGGHPAQYIPAPTSTFSLSELATAPLPTWAQVLNNSPSFNTNTDDEEDSPYYEPEF